MQWKTGDIEKTLTGCREQLEKRANCLKQPNGLRFVNSSAAFASESLKIFENGMVGRKYSGLARRGNLKVI